MTRHEQEQAIAHDLALCDIGLAFAKGALRKRYLAQRKACYDQIRKWNVEDGHGAMSLNDILAELSG